MFSDGLEYKILPDGSAAVCGIGECTDEEISIPFMSPDGRVVSAISDRAFFRCNKLTKLYLPASVQIVGAYAFAWCPSLCEVHMDGVRRIEERAFIGCGCLAHLNFSLCLEFIGEKSFAHCSSLLFIDIPDSVICISDSAFEGCRCLIGVTLPNSLGVISNSAFSACVSLKNVLLPKNLDYIDEYAFAFCPSLNISAIPENTVINGNAFYHTVYDKVS